MGYIKRAVFSYYKAKGLNEREINLRYKSIQLIILFNYELELAVKELAMQEHWFNLDELTYNRKWNNTAKEFIEILSELGVSKYKHLKEAK